jgi:predicted XRE-type DNA-binding protein
MNEHTTPADKSVLDELGLSSENAENLKIRAKLMDSLIGYIQENNLNQSEAADRLGVQQGRVSLLMNGRISKFTIDALINMHSHAGIEVRVEPVHA